MTRAGDWILSIDRIYVVTSGITTSVRGWKQQSYMFSSLHNVVIVYYRCYGNDTFVRRTLRYRTWCETTLQSSWSEQYTVSSSSFSPSFHPSETNTFQLLQLGLYFRRPCREPPPPHRRTNAGARTRRSHSHNKPQTDDRKENYSKPLV